LDPRTRQSADHSMAYIIATLIRKASELGAEAGDGAEGNNELWKRLMLNPHDYKEDESAVFNEKTRAIMGKITFEHGGQEYDKNYPDGIPTSLVIETRDGRTLDSGFVMYPAGHARNTGNDLEGILEHKFRLFAGLAVKDVDAAVRRVGNMAGKSAQEIQGMLDIPFEATGGFE